MSAKEDRLHSAEFQQMIERQIDQRTWGRIHRLRVESSEGRLVIYGHTASYHVKQLALLAAHEGLGATGPTEIDLQIQVGESAPRLTRREYGNRVSDSA